MINYRSRKKSVEPRKTYNVTLTVPNASRTIRAKSNLRAPDKVYKIRDYLQE